RRRRRGDGVRGVERGHRAHLSRAPVAVRSAQGGGARGGQTHAELLIPPQPGRIVNDALPAIAAWRDTLTRELAPVLARRNIVLDASQRNALARLERLHEELVAF